jgi:hypothetical protein
MTKSPGRIWFPGNPWPAGHGLEALSWTGRVDQRGLHFDLHLQSVPYYSEAEAVRDDIDSDWESVGCWSNYHRCTLSSTFWGQDDGIAVADEDDPLDWDALDEWIFEVDSRVDASDHDEHSFHIYLMGHDSVARHRIHFFDGRGRTFALRWDAKVALTYVGKRDFDHALRVDAPALQFGGFAPPANTPRGAAKALFARFVVDPSRYQLRGGVFLPK